MQKESKILLTLRIENIKVQFCSLAFHLVHLYSVYSVCVFLKSCYYVMFLFFVFVFHVDESLYVSFDFASYGDLRSFLRKHRLPSGSANISSLSPTRLLRFAVDVAKAMDYLSSLDVSTFL